MARITEQQKIQINELYAKYGVKAQVARELGISAASVSRYIIPNYIPIAQRSLNLKPIETETFVPEINVLAQNFIKLVNTYEETIGNAVLLSADEWKALNEMQEKEIF